MATQQVEKPRKQRHDSLRWIGIIIFVLAIILLVVAGYSWLTKVWGDQTNTLSAIFSISGTFFSLIGLLTFLSSRDAKPSPSSQPPQPFVINNYVNPPQISAQQDIPLSTSDRHTHPTNIETGKQLPTAPDHQLHQGGSASSFLNASPTAAQVSAPTVPSDSFFESTKSTNKRSAMKLTYKERSDLADALLEVYPTQEDFEMMFEIRFNRKLNTLVDGFHDYRMRVYRLIERTEAEGWTYHLIIAVHEERPLNSALQNWLQKYEAEQGPPEAQQSVPISSRIAKPPQDDQTIATEQEQQKVDISVEGDIQEDYKSKQVLSTEQARESVREAHHAVQQSRVIFAGRGDIQQSHYSQATAALSQVASCTQALQNFLQTISPLPAYLDRERLIMDLRYINTKVGESIKQIANYDTLNAHQRERNRKDTESRLSAILTHLDNLGMHITSKGPL